MSRPTKLLLGLALFLCASLAVAQSNLGELLDAGARKLTVDEFKAELVQRSIVGQTPSGASLEILYTKTGAIAGQALVPNVGPMTLVGEWTTDDDGRICTSMVFTRATMELLRRCEFWFKYKEQYFLSVSDSDRQARLLRRTIKQ
jgi:hypothetical protein